LEKPEDVTLGDGHVVIATGRGVVKTEIESPNGQKGKSCVLQDVLYVPSVSYNLVSVSKATESGKTVKFNKDGCHILDESQKLIATAKRVGNLYYLNCMNSHQANSTVGYSSVGSKEVTWHKRFGHLGIQNLQKLAKKTWLMVMTMTNQRTLISVNLVPRESIIEVNSQSTKVNVLKRPFIWYTVMFVVK
jgi:hypothetical protein